MLAEQDSSIPMEQLYENMWIVDKYEYDTCKVNTSLSSFINNRNLLRCDAPFELKYYEMVFRPYSAPGSLGLEFTPGRIYYFIGKNRVLLSIVFF